LNKRFRHFFGFLSGFSERNATNLAIRRGVANNVRPREHHGYRRKT